MASSPNPANDPGNTSNQPPTVKQVGICDPTPLTEASFWKESKFDLSFRDQHQRFPRGNSSSSAANDDTIFRDGTCNANGLPVTVVRALPEIRREQNRVDQQHRPEPFQAGSTPDAGDAGSSRASPKDDDLSPLQWRVIFPRLRRFKVERIKTSTEFIQFFHQICQVIQFMHNCNLAFPEWTAENVVVGSFRVDLNGSDPTSISRKMVRRYKVLKTRAPRYYLIDLRLCPQTAPRDSAREHTEEHCNICKAHIGRLGELVSNHFMKYNGFDSMQDLLELMKDRKRCPGIECVMKQSGEIIQRRFATNSRLIPQSPSRLSQWIAQLRQCFSRRNDGNP